MAFQLNGYRRRAFISQTSSKVPRYAIGGLGCATAIDAKPLKASALWKGQTLWIWMRSGVQTSPSAPSLCKRGNFFTGHPSAVSHQFLQYGQHEENFHHEGRTGGGRRSGVAVTQPLSLVGRVCRNDTCRNPARLRRRDPTHSWRHFADSAARRPRATSRVCVFACISLACSLPLEGVRFDRGRDDRRPTLDRLARIGEFLPTRT